MRLRDRAFLIKQQFLSRKLRTLLTMFAIGVGMGTMFLLLSLVYGLQDLVVNKIAPVEALQTVDVMPGREAHLTVDTVRRLEKLEAVSDITPSYLFSGEASLNTGSFANAVINAVPARHLVYTGTNIGQGRNLTDGSREAVVSRSVLQLFSTDASIVGKTLQIRNLRESGGTQKQAPFFSEPLTVTVVGITEEEDAATIYVDYEPINAVVNGQVPYNLIKIKASTVEDMEFVKAQINAIGYEAAAVYDLVEQTSSLFGYIRNAFALLGLVGLFVATVGMFNTLTISLLERIRDIGFMKAFGMTNRQVRGLFLTEAAMIGLGGGVLGTVMGAVIAYALNSLVAYYAQSVGSDTIAIFLTPTWVWLFTIFFSGFLGYITGLYPARRAAGVSALEAIRYE